MLVHINITLNFQPQILQFIITASLHAGLKVTHAILLDC